MIKISNHFSYTKISSGSDGRMKKSTEEEEEEEDKMWLIKIMFILLLTVLV